VTEGSAEVLLVSSNIAGLVLAPRGRNAMVAKGILLDAGLRSDIA
jgi:hypothetical protein